MASYVIGQIENTVFNSSISGSESNAKIYLIDGYSDLANISSLVEMSLAYIINSNAYIYVDGKWSLFEDFRPEMIYPIQFDTTGELPDALTTPTGAYGIFGYIKVSSDYMVMLIAKSDEFALSIDGSGYLPGSVIYVPNGSAFMLSPSKEWVYLNDDLQKMVAELFSVNGRLAERVKNGDIGGYTLPAATASVLGGVKVGTGLSIDSSGILSADSLTPAENVAEIADQQAATAPDCAEAINAIISSLIAAGLMFSAPAVEEVAPTE